MNRLSISTIFLILVNLFTIGVAIWQNWSGGEVVLLYYIQSLVIGFFQFFKILDLQNFTTEGVLVNGNPAAATSATKYFFAGFFVVHYGMFHLVYLFFLFAFINIGLFQLLFSPYFLISVLLIVSNHAISFITNREEDRKRRVNIGKIFILPYARILPMHLIIILMGFFTVNKSGNMNLLIAFMALKTIADVITHNIEHSVQKDEIKS
ncbi:MAG: DUF6498-containing protein [Candidatus Dojkabacteria bacterium]